MSDKESSFLSKHWLDLLLGFIIVVMISYQYWYSQQTKEDAILASKWKDFVKQFDTQYGTSIRDVNEVMFVLTKPDVVATIRNYGH